MTYRRRQGRHEYPFDVCEEYIAIGRTVDHYRSGEATRAQPRDVFQSPRALPQPAAGRGVRARNGASGWWLRNAAILKLRRQFIQRLVRLGATTSRTRA
jgi:hypothetical protein